MATVATERLRPRVAIVDDNPSHRRMLGQKTELAGFLPVPLDRKYATVDELVQSVREADVYGVLCDHRLREGNYAGFDGAEAVAALYGLPKPAILVTDYGSVDINGPIRRTGAGTSRYSSRRARCPERWSRDSGTASVRSCSTRCRSHDGPGGRSSWWRKSSGTGECVRVPMEPERGDQPPGGPDPRGPPSPPAGRGTSSSRGSTPTRSRSGTCSSMIFNSHRLAGSAHEASESCGAGRRPRERRRPDRYGGRRGDRRRVRAVSSSTSSNTWVPARWTYSSSRTPTTITSAAPRT